ncbi:hypothetical protein QBC47DRAFT_402872 [Echria macrotheca]|uniref:Hydrophobin n=1 Tax=Echria macrotheca TaxID=438768 RepID=A0AAJ0FAS2_9PEZI|nr:hypothetical protein QBC47DRAFT_402872 [Echria macrotheca]
MQVLTITTLLITAMSTAAAPAPAAEGNTLVARGGTPAPSCADKPGTKPVCCDGLVPLATCTVVVAGKICGSTACCATTTQNTGATLVNVNIGQICVL